MSWVEVKNALNSTLGTNDFLPLDKMINKISANIYNEKIFLTNGTFTVPVEVDTIYISGCGAGGNGTNATSSDDGVAGKAGQYLLQEVVGVKPGEKFTITVGNGNTIISSDGGYSKTLAANSITDDLKNNILGYYAGDFGRVNQADSKYPNGKHSPGGAFGFGGGMGGTPSAYQTTTKYKGGNGGSFLHENGYTGTDTSKFYGSVGSSGKADSTIGGNGGNAGGYGAAGGAGARNNGKGGKGSPGFVLIQWGDIRK